MQCDSNQLAIGHNGSVEELKYTVFGCFNRGDKTRHSGKSRTHLASYLTKNPPIVTVGRPIILITLRFYALQHPLKCCRIAGTRFLYREPEKINNQHIARLIGEVT
ncbi:MAG: hypothetical protein ACTS5I_17675, partial [Rhodanobacter sp.]